MTQVDAQVKSDDERTEGCQVQARVVEAGADAGSVSDACQVMGVSRDSPYRFKDVRANRVEVALRELSRKEPNLRNRIDPAIEAAAVALALEQLAFGPVRVSNEPPARWRS